MKLVEFAPHREGQILGTRALVSWGPCYQVTEVPRLTNPAAPNEPENYTTDIEVQNGWYLRVNFPWSRTQSYVDPDDYEVKTGPCSLRWVITRRRIYGGWGILKTFWLRQWSPVGR